MKFRSRIQLRCRRWHPQCFVASVFVVPTKRFGDVQHHKPPPLIPLKEGSNRYSAGHLRPIKVGWVGWLMTVLNELHGVATVSYG